MKRTERHHLKENEVANWVLDLKEQYEANRNIFHYAVIAVLVVALGVAGTAAWRSMSQSRAAGMLAEAMTVAESPVTAPVAGEAGKVPTQPAGTFPTDKARLEAALPKFMATAETYASSEVGAVARYRAAATLVALGRTDEGVRQYQQVIEHGTGVVLAMAKLGVADAQITAGKFDEAVSSLKTLTEKANDDTPIDGILMQLGRAYRLAGKGADARKTFQRVVEEYPASVYVSEARRQIEAL
jgi:predicted negative regulator of RcsB-dependent stress response